jgi:hypothetical protein
MSMNTDLVKRGIYVWRRRTQRDIVMGFIRTQVRIQEAEWRSWLLDALIQTKIGMKIKQR